MAKRASTEATIANLRQQNARLKDEVAWLQKSATKSSKGHARKLLRKLAVVLSMAFASILLIVGNIFFWVGNTFVKQDRFVAATAPVIRDQQVQHAMSLYATNQIFMTFDVPGTIAGVLPPRADFLAPQLASQFRGYTQTALQKALATPRLQNTWNTVVARQHERLIEFARTYQGNGTITLNDMFNQLTANVSGTKLAFLANKHLPPKVGSITIVTASWLPVLHDVVTHIDTWRTLSIIGFIVFVALAIWLSRNRRRSIYMLSLLLVLGLVISVIVLRVLRQQVIAKVSPQYATGVTHAIQIVFHGFVLQTSTIVIFLIILACITWISGGSSGAQATKRQLKSLSTDKLHDAIFGEENRATAWVGRNRRLLEWGVIALFIICMLTLQLTLGTLLAGVLLTILAVIIIEVLSDQAGRHTA